MTIVLGQNYPLDHTHQTETQDTRFALPTIAPKFVTGWTDLTKEQHAALCKLQPGDSISLNRQRE